MKLRFALLTLCFALLRPALAQQGTYAPRLWENWSVTLSGGIYHPAVYSFTGELVKPSLSLKMKKQFTPVLGFLVEGDGYQGNRRLEHTFYDRVMVLMGGEFNLMNLFGGYRGRPRMFEFETKFGIGWGHTFRNRKRLTDENYLVSKVGGNFILNLGAKRAWSLVLQPALLYDLRSTDAQHHEAYNINQADIQVLLGLTYHFGNGHGGRHPALIVTPPAPIGPDALPQVPDRRSALTDKTLQDTLTTLKSALEQQEQRISELQTQLQNVGAEIDSLTQGREGVALRPQEKKVLESIITFRAGRTTVDAVQFPNVERLATYLNRHPRARLTIRGYASPDGDAELNAKMAQQRAEIVKTLLIAQYGIQPERITARGAGVGKEFTKTEWNRVAVCTIVE